MWKTIRQLNVGVEHRYANDYLRIDIHRYKGNEKLFLVYYPETDSFTVQRRSACGCLNGSDTIFVTKFIRRRPYKKLSPEERFDLIRSALLEQVPLEDSFISTTLLPYSCEICTCSRCSNYLEDCECRCSQNHLMKECACTCPHCMKKLTQCECWCERCGDSYFSEEHEYKCEWDEEDDCGCCPCCGCTCDDWYDEDDDCNDSDEAQTSTNE